MSVTAAASVPATSPTRPVPPLPAGRETYRVDPGHSEVSFQIRHLVSKVRGRFTDFDAEIVVDRNRPESSRVRFAIRAASIDTGLADRDGHLRSADFFDVEQHPEIVFESAKVRPEGENRYAVEGTLTLRGVSRKIEVPVEFLGFVTDPWGNAKAGFEISWKLNRKDFGIVWNAALDNGGVILGDEVAIAINLEVARDPEAA